MNIAVIFAGGVGSRMHSKGLPKQFLSIHGVPIIVQTLDVFQQSDEIDAIVVACVNGWIDYLQNLVDKYKLSKLKKIVPGGTSGQMSIYQGLCAASELSGEDDSIVLIHDGVRPLINQQVISDNIRSVHEHGSAITCTHLKETLVVINESEAISEIPSRRDARIAKAPQSFWLKDIMEAHCRAQKEGRDDFIDSCSLMRHYGHTLYMVDGPESNIKVTTPEDFYIMRALLDAKENAQIYGVNE